MLEKKVKNFSYLILFVSVFVAMSLILISDNQVLNDSQEISMNNAERHIVELESTLNSCLKIVVQELGYIENDPDFKSYSNGSSFSESRINSAFLHAISSQPFVYSISFVDTAGFELIKFEKNDNDIVEKISERDLSVIDEDEIIDYVIAQNNPIYTQITPKDIYNNGKIKPVFKTMYPVTDEIGDVIGVLISYHLATNFLNRVTDNALFDVILYNKNADIIMENNTVNDLSIKKSKPTLIFDNFDYKKMLTGNVYRNETTVSKILKLHYNFYDGIGIQLKSNSYYINEIRHSFREINLFFFLLFSIMLILMLYIIRHYINDAHKFDEIHKYNKWLENKNERLFKDSLIDQMTHIGNKKHYNEKIYELFDLYNRYNTTFSMFVFDIDNLSSIKETHGNDVVDELIVQLVENVNTFIRTSDIFIRYDENVFVIILPNTDKKFAIKFADKMLEFIRMLTFNIHHESLHITISAGVDEVMEGDTSLTIYKRNFLLMDEAKVNGKNTFCHGKII